MSDLSLTVIGMCTPCWSKFRPSNLGNDDFVFCMINNNWSFRSSCRTVSYWTVGDSDTMRKISTAGNHDCNKRAVEEAEDSPLRSRKLSPLLSQRKTKVIEKWFRTEVFEQQDKMSK